MNLRHQSSKWDSDEPVFDPDPNKEGIQDCTGCGQPCSVDEHGYSYCCMEPTVPTDYSKR